MKAYLALIDLVLLITVSANGVAHALSYPPGQVGQDISWPNCDHLKFTPAPFGIVGVNGGLSFYPNNCIGEEASIYKSNLSLYVNTGYPGLPYTTKYAFSPKSCSLSDNVCLAYNYGYNAGKYAVDYSLDHEVVSNNWWLDVEVVNSWTINSRVNISSLAGEQAAIEQSLKPNFVGYYSYPTQWSALTNNWKNGQPTWLATDSNYKKAAVKECGSNSFNGGKIVLTQYIGSLDLDLACSL